MKKYIVHSTLGKKQYRSVVRAASANEAANTVRNALRIRSVEPAPPEAKEDASIASLKRIMNQLSDLFN